MDNSTQQEEKVNVVQLEQYLVQFSKLRDARVFSKQRHETLLRREHTVQDPKKICKLSQRLMQADESLTYAENVISNIELELKKAEGKPRPIPVAPLKLQSKMCNECFRTDGLHNSKCPLK